MLIAWGTTQGGAGQNTIGRDSTPLGKAQVRIADQTLAAEHNWIEVKGLRPDTSYPYEVDLDGRRIGGSVVRTWPARATRLTFFVIGDYGDAGAGATRRRGGDGGRVPEAARRRPTRCGSC